MFAYFLMSCSLFTSSDNTPVTVSEPSVTDQRAKAQNAQAEASKAEDPKAEDPQGKQERNLLGLFFDKTALSIPLNKDGTTIPNGTYPLDCLFAYFCDDEFYSYLSHAQSTVTLQSPHHTPYEIGSFYGGFYMAKEGMTYALASSGPFGYDPYIGLSDLFEIWFGNTLFHPQTDEDSFQRVNAEAVTRWSAMLPAPNTPFQSTTTKEIYQSIFVHFARQLAHAYVYLVNEGIADHAQAYRHAYENDTTDYQNAGFEHLRTTYPNPIPDTSAPMAQMLSDTELAQSDYGYFTPSMAVGFWLRRHIDGSDEVLWKVALDILEQYDTEWLQGLKAKYPKQKKLWVGARPIVTKDHLFDPSQRAYIRVNGAADDQKLIIDGRSYGSHGIAVVATGEHQVTYLNCDRQTEDLQHLPQCHCSKFTVTLGSGLTTLDESSGSQTICHMDGRSYTE